ncbi:MAG: 30S ribosomal protein S8 [Acidobacteriia bacterium]|nr:30S ribosomal protein S8 [Terriglobia bacterium]
MVISDPVADMLTRIRNGIRAKHSKVDIPASRLKAEIARILREEGFVSNYKVIEEGGRPILRVYLRYAPTKEGVISHLERVSKPGCRVFVERSKIPKVLGGLGINILTTSRGVMTGKTARREGVGGEILCNVW